MNIFPLDKAERIVLDKNFERDNVPRISPNPHLSGARIRRPCVPEVSLILNEDLKRNPLSRILHGKNSNGEQKTNECGVKNANHTNHVVPFEGKDVGENYDVANSVDVDIQQQLRLQDLQLQKLQRSIAGLVEAQKSTVSESDTDEDSLSGADTISLKGGKKVSESIGSREETLNSQMCNQIRQQDYQLKLLQGQMKALLQNQQRKQDPFFYSGSGTKNGNDEARQQDSGKSRNRLFDSFDAYNGPMLSSRRKDVTEDSLHCCYAGDKTLSDEDFDNICTSQEIRSPELTLHVDMLDYQDTTYAHASPVFGESVSICNGRTHDSCSNESFYRSLMANIKDILETENAPDEGSNVHDSNSNCDPEDNLRGVDKGLDDSFLANIKDVDECGSAYDTFVTPRLNYVSMFLDGETFYRTDESFRFNKLAMKYLPDEALSNAGWRPKDGSQCKNLLRKTLLKNSARPEPPNVKHSDKTMYGVPDMSFASKNYLQKYGLLPCPHPDQNNRRQAADRSAEQRSAVASELNDRTECNDRILDITSLKLQPKLL